MQLAEQPTGQRGLASREQAPERGAEEASLEAQLPASPQSVGMLPRGVRGAGAASVRQGRLTQVAGRETMRARHMLAARFSGQGQPGHMQQQQRAAAAARLRRLQRPGAGHWRWRARGQGRRVIAVGLSGGVDSAVAAMLLEAAGVRLPPPRAAQCEAATRLGKDVCLNLQVLTTAFTLWTECIHLGQSADNMLALVCMVPSCHFHQHPWSQS